MNNSTALITGASSGIGFDIANVLAEKRFNLILVARREDRLKSISESLVNQHHVQCHYIVCDLSEPSERGTLINDALFIADNNELVLDILVNNAGNGSWGNFSSQESEDHQRTISLNVSAPTLLCHQFINKRISKISPSWILNVSSLSAILPAPRFAVYSGTKGYLKNFSEALAHELRRTNISVTCSCPGGVLTEFMEHAGQSLKGKTGMMTSRDVAERMVDAMFRGDTIHVPGGFNKLARITSLLPSTIRSLIVEKSMNITVK